MTDNWVITNPEKMGTCQPYDACQGWIWPCKGSSRKSSAKFSTTKAIDVEMSGSESARDGNTAEAALSKARKEDQRRFKRKQIEQEISVKLIPNSAIQAGLDKYAPKSYVQQQTAKGNKQTAVSRQTISNMDGDGIFKLQLGVNHQANGLMT